VILRSLPHESSKIFLTFDDGPDAVSTPRILDLLARKRALATFFVIGEKAARSSEIVARMRSDGHAVGDHSSDHRYRNFFRGQRHLKIWLGRSARSEALHGGSVGFRPPAGILTPRLIKAAEESGIPLILWNERFYDAVWSWSASRARKSAATLKGGSIVLLHDRQSPARLEKFLATLEIYIDALRARGFEFACLTPARMMAKNLALSVTYTSHSETVPG
jgi:peptidoglycan-N-acetylglucosamine deacetylase